MSPTSENDWLSLSEVAKILGVHPSTIRQWSDKGALPVHRTQGGHRRYKRSEVELWAEHARNAAPPELQSIIQRAVRNVRLQIAEGRLQAEGWYQKLNDEARDQYRQSARTMVHGLMAYLTADKKEAASEAHSIGYEYASRASRFGLSRVDAVQAFLFFRNSLVDAIMQTYQEANIPSGQVWGEMLRQVQAFTDLILLHLLETFEALESNSKG